MIVALVGAFIIFHLETQRSIEFQKNVFKRTYAAVAIETSNNVGKINRLIASYNSLPTNQIDLTRLNTDVTREILRDPLVYKFSGKEYLLSMQAYHAQVDATNKVIDTAFQIFSQTGQIPSSLQQTLIGKLEDTMINTFIFQIVNDYYSIGYDVKVGPSTPAAEQVDNWLRHRPKPSIDDLQQELDRLTNMSDEEKKTLQDNLKRIEME